MIQHSMMSLIAIRYVPFWDMRALNVIVNEV